MAMRIARILITVLLLLPVAVDAATLTFVAGPNGSLSGSTTQTIITGGTSTPVTASPTPGYHFINWTGTNGFATSTANPLIVSNVSLDQTITANFTTSIDTFSIVTHGLSNAVDVKGGASHTVVLRKDGTVVAWGGTDGQSTVPTGLTGVIAIGAGTYNTLAVRGNGSVVGWGVYRDGTSAGPIGPQVPANLTGVTAVAGGYSHSIALKSDGTVTAWGDNSYGQGTVPAGLSGVIAIAAGHYHNVALKSDGTVVAWGRNFEGQTTIPSGLSGVSAVDAKAYHTVALKKDGTVVCWGDNEKGQSDVPAGLSGVKAIAAGGHHTLALKNDGTLVAWGDDEFGQVTTPPGLVGITMIRAGTYHTLAVKGDVAVVGWGHNQSLQCDVPLSVYQGIGNGSVSCNPTTVVYGNSAVCTVSPAAGFATSVFAVNGVDKKGGIVNGSITLPNIQAYQTVTAVFANSTSTSVAMTSPANGASYTAPATIPLSASAAAGIGATVSKVEFFRDTSLIGTVTAAPYNFSWSNVAAGSYSLTAKVTDSLGVTATSVPVTVTVTSSTLPTPWLGQDIGSVGVAGSSGYLNGTFTVTGSGSDIWGSADSFRFVYQTLSGDGQIVARVVSLQNTNGYAKGGVMIRDTLAANSAHAMMDVTPLNGAEFSRRTLAGGTTVATGVPGLAAPYWVKLVRSGSNFTGYVSSDGVNWTLVGSSSITMGSSVFAGIIVNSHNNATLCSATIGNVTVSAGSAVSPTVTITAPLNGASFSAPATVAVTATATAGTGATVKQVDFFSGSTLIGTATAAPYSVTLGSLAAGGYSLTARVTDSRGATATSAAVMISVAGSSSLPSPWTTQDIGSVAVTGSATYNNGVFTLKGSGLDIWGTSDAFRFGYKPLTGDGQIVARVASLQNTSGWAKAGVMIRQSLTPDSVHAMMDVTPGSGAEFSRRSTTGGSTTVSALAGVAAPYWVKLVRSGNTFTGYVSGDGVTWTQVGTSTISMTSSVYIGLVVTSHNTILCTATVDSVQ
jgi:uncharacterized repeat protein (TIGR02543 family)